MQSASVPCEVCRQQHGAFSTESGSNCQPRSESDSSCQYRAPEIHAELLFTQETMDIANAMRAESQRQTKLLDALTERFRYLELAIEDVKAEHNSIAQTLGSCKAMLNVLVASHGQKTVHNNHHMAPPPGVSKHDQQGTRGLHLHPPALSPHRGKRPWGNQRRANRRRGKGHRHSRSVNPPASGDYVPW